MPGSAHDIDGGRRRFTEVVLILVLILIEILFLPAEVGGARLNAHRSEETALGRGGFRLGLAVGADFE